ncbi:hypothetical protein MHM582_3231 [Microbacterium sp. HM58-2]|nr:hypothetical protein MHM582_3231 [Microbacterium sp. HM58-2]
MSTEDQTPDATGSHGGHTPLTPPPATPATPPAASAPPATPPLPAEPPAASRIPGATAITVVTAVIGGIALLGSGATAAVAASGDLVRTDTVQTLDVTGITGLDLDVNASDVRIEFGDVSDAELAVTSGRGRTWTLERDDDELLVRSPDTRFGWWFGNWFDDEETVVLTLPEELQDGGLDASLTLNAGSLTVSGTFAELDVEVTAGDLTVDGAATVLDAQLSAGGADILLDGVKTADFGVSAGDLAVELTGTAPTDTTIDVSAGELDLTVPEGGYRVTQSVSAGTLDNELDQDSDSRRTIDVSVSAGTVTLRPGS